MKIYDYIKSKDEIIVSPIWAGKKEFDFLCMGHITWAEALGFKTYEATSVLKLVEPNQIKGYDDFVNHLDNYLVNSEYILEEVNNLKSMKKYHSENKIDGLIGGGSFGPLTIVSDILGVEKLLRMIVKDKKLVADMLQYVTDNIIELAKREDSEGIDFFWIAEPLASLISPKKFWDFSGMYLKEIFESVNVDGFLHVCGKTTSHTKVLEKTGAKLLSIDYLSDIKECLDYVNYDTVIMGNVNPSTLRFGSKKEIENELNSIIEKCMGHNNFVLSTGCSIMDQTPDDSVKTLFDVAKKRSGDWINSLKKGNLNG